MKEYKRLSNNNLEEYNPEYDFCMGCEYFGEPNGCNRWNGTCANYERFIETYDRLSELEDKIENGTLIELPCKVGDTVYIACKWDIDKVVQGTVFDLDISFNMKRHNFLARIYVNHDFIYSDTNKNIIQNRYIFYESEIFLTKAEAEAKLKELQK